MLSERNPVMTEQPKHKKNGGSRLPDVKKKQAPDGRKRKEKIIMVVMIILAVIMVLAATVAVLYTRWVKKPVLPSGPVGASAGPAVSKDLNDPEGPLDEMEEPDYDPVQPKVGGERKSEDFYTILVFGADVASGLTDTMMVVSYDVTNQRATVMSIPRDTLANTRFSGVDAKKMNAVYKMNGKGEKGVEALKSEVSELVGFVPDYYVMIDWELVGQMVEAIGGVWYDVPYHMEYFDPYQDLNIYIEKGYQKLDGEHAMQLVRWRKNNKGVSGGGDGSDTNRLAVQHGFLKAVLQQTLQIQNLTKISKLAKLFGENVTSDLTIENLFWFGSQAIMGGLNVDDVEFVTMPYGIGSYPVKSGSEWDNRSFVYPSQKKLLTMINEGLNPFADNVTLRELDLIYTNSNGGISATSGKLADPSMAALPAAYLEWKNGQTNPDPSESEPIESDPVETDPMETAPITSADPGNADPSESDWPSRDPDPGESETPAAPSPEVPIDIPSEPFVPLD